MEGGRKRVCSPFPWSWSHHFSLIFFRKHVRRKAQDKRHVVITAFPGWTLPNSGVLLFSSPRPTRIPVVECLVPHLFRSLTELGRNHVLIRKYCTVLLLLLPHTLLSSSSTGFGSIITIMNASSLRDKLRNSFDEGQEFLMGLRDRFDSIEDDDEISVQSASTGFPDDKSIAYKNEDKSEDEDKSSRDGSNVRFEYFVLLVDILYIIGWNLVSQLDVYYLVQMVYIVLLLAAIVFGVATYLLLDAGSDREFKSEVSQSFQWRLSRFKLECQV